MKNGCGLGKKNFYHLRKLPGEGGTSDGRIRRPVSTMSGCLPVTEQSPTLNCLLKLYSFQFSNPTKCEIVLDLKEVSDC